MNAQLRFSNIAVIIASFGCGLMLAGRYLLGLAAIIVGLFIYLRHRSQSQNSLANQKNSNSETHLEEPPPIDNWYYEKNGIVAGPLLEAQIFELIKIDDISNETLVYNAAIGEEWRALEDTHFIKRNHHRPY